ncbi:MAG: hypothetical protein WDO70_08290 [Alphaproteobacteria bacterium]
MSQNEAHEQAGHEQAGGWYLVKAPPGPHHAQSVAQLLGGIDKAALETCKRTDGLMQMAIVFDEAPPDSGRDIMLTPMNMHPITALLHRATQASGYSDYSGISQSHAGRPDSAGQGNIQGQGYVALRSHHLPEMLDRLQAELMNAATRPKSAPQNASSPSEHKL